jgi:toxin-antitoxin system PIN domain toxin
MMMPDANVLIYAFRKELPQHALASDWLRNVLAGGEMIGLVVPVELAFLRLMTKPLGGLPPAPWERAWAFMEALGRAPNVRRIHAGSRHPSLFSSLCSGTLAGDSVTDCYIAALALENKATLISADKGFGRFQELKWVNPFA